jgi:hypothetical protein
MGLRLQGREKSANCITPYGGFIVPEHKRRNPPAPTPSSPFDEDDLSLLIEPVEGGDLPAMGSDPLEGMSELLGTFYPAPPPIERRSAQNRSKPEHYKVICISLYTEDLDRLDALVETLKAQGHTRASRSQLIRFALAQVDLARFPRRL